MIGIGGRSARRSPISASEASVSPTFASTRCGRHAGRASTVAPVASIGLSRLREAPRRPDSRGRAATRFNPREGDTLDRSLVSMSRPRLPRILESRDRGSLAALTSISRSRPSGSGIVMRDQDDRAGERIQRSRGRRGTGCRGGGRSSSTAGLRDRPSAWPVQPRLLAAERISTFFSTRSPVNRNAPSSLRISAVLIRAAARPTPRRPCCTGSGPHLVLREIGDPPLLPSSRVPPSNSRTPARILSRCSASPFGR